MNRFTSKTEVYKQDKAIVAINIMEANDWAVAKIVPLKSTTSGVALLMVTYIRRVLGE